MDNNNICKLTHDEEEIASEFDSRLFGFIKFDNFENVPKKYLLLKAIQNYENRVLNEDNNRNSAQFYATLGHWYLLLEDYSKALASYQKSFNYNIEDLQDSTFFYGTGLVYFYFGAFRFAIKSFLSALYKDSGFLRTNEIHFRLALIYKELRQFEFSLKHFNLAHSDSNNSSISKQEIKFCIAHLYETNEKHLIASEKYDELLKLDDISETFRAKVLRQIGWLYFYSDQLSNNNNNTNDQSSRLKAPINQLYAKPNQQNISINLENLNKVLEYLAKSTELDPNQCLTWYYLGRANTTKGNIRDAFNSFRNSVNSIESNADTWCSIGVLYQQQNQSMDALQAYICAVQLDDKNYAAWLNLGILYEALSQYQDALNCYVKALNSNKTSINCSKNLELEQLLKERIKILEAYVKHTQDSTMVNNNDNKNKLPVLQEAFSLPIPTEVSSRKPPAPVNSNPICEDNNQIIQKQNVLPINNFSNQTNNYNGQPPLKKTKSTKKNEIAGLTQQQMMLMHQLEMNNNLNPDQLHMLNHLKSQFSQAQQKNTFNNNQMNLKNNTVLQNKGNGVAASNSFLDCFTDGLPQDLENVNPTMNSSQDLHMLLAQHDIAEDLRSSDGDKCGLDHILAFNSGNKFIAKNSNKNISTSLIASNDFKKSYPIELLKLDPSLNMQQETKINEPIINIDMNSNQILKACKGLGLNGIQNTSILSPKCISPSKSSIRSIKQLTVEQLNPITPSVVLESKRDALSSQLQQYCISNPISVVRGIAGVLKLDLSLFSTKTLVETDGDHVVEVRTQRQQTSDENWDTLGKSNVWICESSRSLTTIAKYAQYQAFTFQEALKEESSNKNCSSSNLDDNIYNDINKASKYAPNIDNDNQTNSKLGNNASSLKKFKMIKFCTNVDLSDEKKWKIQLQELAKLPPFMRLISACNMLSHVGNKIFGMNTLQLYMKVPGSRTPGHQENNNFCSININIGPGDCEWFGVSQCFWSLIEELCEKNNCDYLNGSWWPKLEDLYENNIPVYRFIQKPGDLVWVNTGCVHWVQAIGWCNNIAWNVGPLVYTQYKSSIERYEWNKYKHYKSIVPIIHLTWNIARNIKISDRRLFELIKYVLMQSLKQTQLSINYIENCELDMKLQPRQLNELAHYCIDCECEVFNILFVSEQDKKHVVHCQDCARRRNHLLDNFVILHQFTLDELKLIYDQFVLYTPPLNSVN